MATNLDKGKVTRLAKLRLGNKDVEMLVTLYPEGTIGFREKGRRSSSEVHLNLASAYQRAVLSDAAIEQKRDAADKPYVRRVSRGLLKVSGR
jgi:hypothetical protein